MRLDKFLTETNIGSRKQVKELIRKGKVSVNNIAIIKPETHIDEFNDTVLVKADKVIYKKYRYFMLNKPAGVVSAVIDSQCKTVVDLIDKRWQKDIFPVGRLDKDTEGLLILTNDGQLSHNLLSPNKHIEKTYYVELDSNINNSEISLLQNGIDIGEDKLTRPAKIEFCDDGCKSKVLISITEGKFHQVKRMFKAVGHKVIYLKRISMGSISLDSNLKLGEYRELTSDEIKKLGGKQV